MSLGGPLIRIFMILEPGCKIFPEQVCRGSSDSDLDLNLLIDNSPIFASVASEDASSEMSEVSGVKPPEFCIFCQILTLLYSDTSSDESADLSTFLETCLKWKFQE